MPPEVMMEKEKWFAAYEVFKKSEIGKQPSWLNSLRDEAMARFRDQDFPTAQDEAWKYTSLEPLLKLAFLPAYEKSSGGWDSGAVEKKLGKLSGPRMVFINGTYAPALSSLTGLPAKVKMANFKSVWTSEEKLIERHWSYPAAVRRGIFSELNRAVFHDGALLYLSKDSFSENPIELIYLSFSKSGNVISHPRNLVIAEKGSRVTVIERYIGLDEGVYFTNAVTDFVLEEGARVDSYRIQKENRQAFHISNTHVSVGRNSHFVSFNLDLGGRLVRHQLETAIQGEGGECDVNGLYVAGDAQHIDNYTVIDHLKPQGKSRQLYKGILDGKAEAVFNGKIFVRRDAQKTDAAQKNKNLLLSGESRVDTRPQLEILADDVKCAHGAAVGQLAEDELFYLRSRGIGEESAKKVLTYGFAHEIVDRIRFEPVKKELEHWLEERFQTAAGLKGVDGGKL